jgi:glycerol-3-phosphate dehydrogenase (NAD(P)+)
VKLGKTAILGAGGWGTALSVLWAKKGHDVLLWGHTPARIERIREKRENSDYLPGITLPDSIRITSDLADCATADLVVFVTPSAALRTVALQFCQFGANQRALLLSCTKGIEHHTGKRMSEILDEIFPDHPIAVLSGPNLASEIARGLPTATVLACSKPDDALALQDHLGSPLFRIYTTENLAGVELGGALKNVFAIAAGASDGLRLGDNSKAALVTRALAEMIRLGTAMGGELATFYGLSGAGDLVLTCFSKQSRNRNVGEQLGRGLAITEITSSMQMVAEGIPTAKSAYECARRFQIDTPIIDQVYALLYQQKSAGEALHELLGREQKAERW